MTLRVSVALATYNGAAYLGEQLDSLTRQTRLPEELIVRDDRSSDGTLQILESFQRTAPFEVRIHVNEQRLGIPGNFDEAVSSCTGDLICFCDQDDIWLPHRIASAERALARLPGSAMHCGDLLLADERMKPTGQTQWERLHFSGARSCSLQGVDLFSQLLRYNVVTGATMTFRRSWVDLILPTPSTWIHDEWAAAILAATGPVALGEEPSVLYRCHDGQSIGPGIRGLAEQWRYAREHMGPDYLRRQGVRTRQLRDRLASAGSRITALNSILENLDARVLHYEQRFRGRAQGGRVRIAAKEAITGRYRRFGYGWKSLAQDLFLA